MVHRSLTENLMIKFCKLIPPWTIRPKLLSCYLHQKPKDFPKKFNSAKVEFKNALENISYYYWIFCSKPYRLDMNSKGRCIILYAKEDIPSKLINSSCTNHEKEYCLVELNLCQQKWLIIFNYNPPKTRIKGYWRDWFILIIILQFSSIR